MKQSDNNQRTQAGFTLVEVIVVAVIVAAMAAVAVPLYLGYVDSSRQNAAANAAGSVASFCGACRNSAGNLVTTGLVAAGGGEIVCNPATGTATRIQIPSEIVVTVNAAVTPGVVTAHHARFASGTSTYNF